MHARVPWPSSAAHPIDARGSHWHHLFVSGTMLACIPMEHAEASTGSGTGFPAKSQCMDRRILNKEIRNMGVRDPTDKHLCSS